MKNFTKEQREELKRVLAVPEIKWSTKKSEIEKLPYGVAYVDDDNSSPSFPAVGMEGNSVAYIDVSGLGVAIGNQEGVDAAWAFISGADNKEEAVKEIHEEISLMVRRSCRRIISGLPFSPQRIGSVCRVAEMLRPGWGRNIMAFSKRLNPHHKSWR